MSRRFPADQLDAAGNTYNGFDYDLQVWVINGRIQACCHPRDGDRVCCNASRYKFKTIERAKLEHSKLVP